MNWTVRRDERNEAYDILDVFNIVYPNQNDLKQESGEVVTTHLLEGYASISVAEVASSNHWFHEWTDDDKDQFHTNLNWSYHVLKNNIDPVLMARLQSKYDHFTTLEQGGPLLFILLMNELLFTNESAIRTLKDQIEKCKISKVAGEDIRKITSIVLSQQPLRSYIFQSDPSMF